MYRLTLQAKAGKITKILMRNFMCHDALEIILNPNVNFIVGRNGSGKSAILTALTVGLGARANVTSRGASVKGTNVDYSIALVKTVCFLYNIFLSRIGFVKKGKNTATIEVTLLNSGSMAYKPEVYGNSITVFRSIGNSSTYKIKNWKGSQGSYVLLESINLISACSLRYLKHICGIVFNRGSDFY